MALDMHALDVQGRCQGRPSPFYSAIDAQLATARQCSGCSSPTGRIPSIGGREPKVHKQLGVFQAIHSFAVPWSTHRSATFKEDRVYGRSLGGAMPGRGTTFGL